jgi:hypothetical protein
VNYPDNINFVALDRSQQSKRLRYAEVQVLNGIDKLMKDINDLLGYGTDADPGLRDALSSLRAAKEDVEDA